MTKKEYEELSVEEKSDIIDSRVCPFCQGRISPYSSVGRYGIAYWKTVCNDCDFIFEED